VSALAVAFVLFGQGVPTVTPLTGPPKLTWLGPPRGDATGSGAGFDPHIEPLRLGLFDDIPPSGDPSCGHVPQFAYYNTTLHLVPRLTLAGFSRVGCMMDGAAGVGLVYAVPVRKNIDLALSLGRLWGPHSGPNGTAVSSTRASADIVFRREGGRSLSVGISASSTGSPGMRFGGVF
jgi:hypothetical protein